ARLRKNNVAVRRPHFWVGTARRPDLSRSAPRFSGAIWQPPRFWNGDCIAVLAIPGDALLARRCEKRRCTPRRFARFNPVWQENALLISRRAERQKCPARLFQCQNFRSSFPTPSVPLPRALRRTWEGEDMFLHGNPGRRPSDGLAPGYYHVTPTGFLSQARSAEAVLGRDGLGTRTRDARATTSDCGAAVGIRGVGLVAGRFAKRKQASALHTLREV